MATEGRLPARLSGWLARRGPQNVALNSANNGGTVFSAQHGNISIHYTEQNYRLEDTADSRPGTSGVSDQPSRLLDPANEVVPFWGRVREQRDLLRWRDRTDSSFAVLLLHGPGGQGKTRLAARFAATSRTDGWRVLRATRDLWMVPGQRGEVPRLTGAVRGTIVMIDYADRWPVADLLRLCQTPELVAAGATRVVLLARSKRWWSQFVHELRLTVGTEAQPYALTPAARTPQDLARLYHYAWEGFSRALGVSGASPTPYFDRPPDETTALHVVMMALAGVYARPAGDDVPSDPPALSAYLLDRERLQWARMHKEGLCVTPPETMGRAVLVATLLGRMPYRAASGVLEELKLSQGESTQRLIDDYERFYPSDKDGHVFAPLVPDRMAEDLLGLTCPGHELPDRDPDPWAADLLAQITAVCAIEGRGGHLRHVLTLFTAAAVRWPHLAHTQLFPLLREDPDIAVRAGATVIATLLQVRDLDAEIMMAIIERLPGERNINYVDAAGELASRLAKLLLRRDADPARRAAIHHMLGERLWHARWRQAAEDQLNLAVDIRRGLAVAPHDVAAIEALATSLALLAEVQEGRRNFSRAFDSAAEAQSRYVGMRGYRDDERLVAALARITEVKARLYSRRRMIAEAAQEQTDAVAVWQELRTDNAAHLPSLAAALDRQAMYVYREAGWKDARAIAKEAVAQWRLLAKTVPHRYEPQLALSLDRSLRYWDRPTAQSSAIRDETISRLRTLAQQNVGYHARFCRSALVWARLTSDAGTALDLLDEALDLAQDLSRRNFARYGSHHADLTLARAQRLAELPDRLQDALATARDGERIFEELLRSNTRHREGWNAAVRIRRHLELRLRKLAEQASAADRVRLPATRAPQPRRYDEYQTPKVVRKGEPTLGGFPVSQICTMCGGAGRKYINGKAELCSRCRGTGVR
jgi:hypothetical protein